MAWELQEALAYYQRQGAPGDQTALVSLLREIQSENGGSVPVTALQAAAQAYGIKESFLQAIIKRIPGLRLGNVHVLELCGGPNCGKQLALAACAEKLAAQRGFELKFVPCMRMCGKGPNIKWNGKLHHQATEALLRQLTQEAIQK